MANRTIGYLLSEAGVFCREFDKKMVSTISLDDFKRLVASGETQFPGLYLPDTAHNDLRDIVFSRLNLKGADLTKTDLILARMDDSNLSDAKLTATNLTLGCGINTRFCNADLIDTLPRTLVVGVCQDPLKNSLSARLELHILAVARKALAECKYGNMASPPVLFSYLTEAKARLGYNPESGHVATCIVNRQWYTTVYRRGLAVLDGKFVLDAGDADHSGVIPVTIARRDPVVRFAAAPAFAVPKQGEAGFRLVLNEG